jgi:hypothetical protein
VEKKSLVRFALDFPFIISGMLGSGWIFFFFKIFIGRIISAMPLTGRTDGAQILWV